jgi:hypothetical protein
VLRTLQNFLKNPQLSELEAANFLRLVYGITFMAQVAVAALVAGVLAGVAGRQFPEIQFPEIQSSETRSSGTLLAQIFIVLSLLQFPLALALSFRVSKAGGKQAALSASIMTGVLFSTPAWFTALVFLVSSPFFYLAILVALLMLYYAIGFMLCSRWAKVALAPDAEKKTSG